MTDENTNKLHNSKDSYTINQDITSLFFKREEAKIEPTLGMPIMHRDCNLEI